MSLLRSHLWSSRLECHLSGSVSTISGLTLGPPLNAEACDLHHSSVASGLQHITTYNGLRCHPCQAWRLTLPASASSSLGALASPPRNSFMPPFWLPLTAFKKPERDFLSGSGPSHKSRCQAPLPQSLKAFASPATFLPFSAPQHCSCHTLEPP